MAWAFFIVGTVLLFGVPAALLTLYLRWPPPPAVRENVQEVYGALIVTAVVAALICYAFAAFTYC